MKRLFALSVGVAVLLIASCDLQAPQTITIEASPSFAIPGGSNEFQISEIWDLEAELEKIADPDLGLTVDQADPEGRLALQLEKELLSISIQDFAGDTLSLDTITQDVNVSYTIPQIEIAGSDFTTNIDPVPLPGSVAIDPLAITPVPETDPSGNPLSQRLTTPTIDATGYTSVTFSQGALNAEISLGNANPSLVVNVGSATIENSVGDPIVEAINTPITATPLTSGILEFPLADIDLPNDFQVAFDISVSGGVLGEFFDLNAAFSFVNGPAISGAAGVNFSDTVAGSHTIPLGADLDFQSLTIGEGSLDLSTELPADWTGVTTPIEVTLRQGGVEVGGPGAPVWPASLPLDLEGITLTNEDITVDYSVDVVGADASFTLLQGVDEVTTSISGSIAQLSEVNVAEASFDTVQTFSQAIDEGIRELVDSATFAPEVLTISLTNKLPVDVSVNISTTPPAIGTQVSLDPNQADTRFPATTGDTPTVRTWDISPNPLPIDMDTIELDVAVDLDDGSPGDGTLTLGSPGNPITPGETYTLVGSVDANFDVTSLTIASVTHSGTFPEAPEPGLDFSMLGDFLPDTITFTDIATSLQLAAGSDTGTLKLHLTVDYLDNISGTTENETLVDNLEISMDEVVPLPGIQNIINARASDIVFTYDITASGATIDTTTTAEESFGAVLISNIPLAINSNGDTEIVDDNDDPIVPRLEEDILGRSGDPGDEESDEELKELILFAEKVSINLDIDNDLGLGLKAQIFEPEDLTRGLGAFDKEIELNKNKGTTTISLSGGEIQRIANDPDFRPEIHLFIPDGDHAILREGGVSLSAWLGVETDISYKFDLNETGGEE